MLDFAETMFAQIGLAGFAGLWVAKAGASYAALRWLRQKQVWTKMPRGSRMRRVAFAISR